MAKQLIPFNLTIGLLTVGDPDYKEHKAFML